MAGRRDSPESVSRYTGVRNNKQALNRGGKQEEAYQTTSRGWEPRKALTACPGVRRDSPTAHVHLECAPRCLPWCPPADCSSALTTAWWPAGGACVSHLPRNRARSPALASRPGSPSSRPALQSSGPLAPHNLAPGLCPFPPDHSEQQLRGLLSHLGAQALVRAPSVCLAPSFPGRPRGWGWLCGQLSLPASLPCCPCQTPRTGLLNE